VGEDRRSRVEVFSNLRKLIAAQQVHVLCIMP
jgi:hypothetical protein